jgi:hypothetical protein
VVNVSSTAEVGEAQKSSGEKDPVALMEEVLKTRLDRS